MYARQLAWLHTVTKRNDKDKNKKSRFETLQDDNPAKSLPDTDNFLVNCFRSIGYHLKGGYGAIPLNWGEIESFTNKSGYQLNGWECEQLFLMSESYCGFLERAKDPNCAPPYRDDYDDIEDIELIRKRVDDKWDSLVSFLS